MKTSVIALSVAALLAFGAATAAPKAASPAASPAAAPAASPAASPAGAKTAQQSKMASCSAANKGKKGDDYKNAMSACLKAPAAAPAPANKPMPATTPPTTTRGNTAQQTKMASCATANKGKKGDDYKNAMSACLKAAPAASGAASGK